MYLSTTQIFNFWQPSIFEAPKISQHNQKFATQKRGSCALKNERMNERTNKLQGTNERTNTNERTTNEQTTNERTYERTNERTTNKRSQHTYSPQSSLSCHCCRCLPYRRTGQANERSQNTYSPQSSSLPDPSEIPSSDPSSNPSETPSSNASELPSSDPRATQAKLRRAIQRTPQTTRRLLRGELMLLLFK